MHTVVEKLLGIYKGKIRVIYKYYPLTKNSQKRHAGGPCGRLRGRAEPFLAVP